MDGLQQSSPESQAGAPLAALDEACAQEPIHIPGAIQPHGALLLLGHGADAPILQASVNAAMLLGAERDPLHRPCGLGGMLGDAGHELAAALQAWREAGAAHFDRRIVLPRGEPAAVSAHRLSEGVVLEIEPLGSDLVTYDDLARDLQAALGDLHDARQEAELWAAAARHVRALTGFDRVLVYRFDEDFNGAVVAEERNERLPSYLDLRFPASDIPRQARALYRLNRLRLIPNAEYAPCIVSPAAGRSPSEAPLDLSAAALRSVSPVHLEYMRNMGTAASMSISVVVDGALWGLISCHHAEPRWIPPSVRQACNLLGQIFAMQVGARERAADAAHRLELKTRLSRLVAEIAGAQARYVDRLALHAEEWLGVVNAAGAALVAGGEVRRVGETPSEDEVLAIVRAIEERKPAEHFESDRFHLAELGEEAQVLCCGLLAVPISRLHPDYVLWFRPEIVRTVRWGGEPAKHVDEQARLHPRRSFAIWKEQVRGRAHPWTAAEVETALELRGAILSIVLRRAEELAELSEELQRSNQELESFAYSVSHDLRAPFRHIVGYAELLSEREEGLDEKSRHYLANIADAARTAGRLVDDLLNFSQMGRTSLSWKRVDMNRLVADVRRSLERDAAGRAVEWRISPLPSALGDAAMLRQVWLNLIDNALKYSRGRNPAVLEISGASEAGAARFQVRDNGVGFDEAYREKLFGVFQRLHRMEEFEGTGIGLAIVKRIVDRHGGEVYAESVLGEGATFAFTLPAAERARDG